MSIYIYAFKYKGKDLGRDTSNPLMVVTTGKRCGFRVEVGNDDQLSHFIHHTYSFFFFFYSGNIFVYCTFVFKIGLGLGNQGCVQEC